LLNLWPYVPEFDIVLHWGKGGFPFSLLLDGSMKAKFTYLLPVGMLGAVIVSALALRLVTSEFKYPHQLPTVPEGFEVELVAGPPLVDRPIVADFDELGRLYVAESSGSNENVQTQLAKKPHRILRLEDTDGDGRFDTRTVFADRMMFPEGAMWFDGSLYVAAPPSIWKLTDTDGNGVADQRVEWFAGKTLTGCANDLHGPYLGLDGWIYWCKGAFAKQTYERPGKPPLVTRAAHIFRARPDGSAVEPVMTGGMDNPVDVVFTPEGERIFSATFLEHPQLGRRDALVHAVYGGLYGKPHDVLDDHKKTGDLLPVLTHFGPAAPCGLTRYESRVFGADYEGNLFTCLFNLQKVTRHVLEPSGATFKTRDSDFLVSNNPDFHPTDVIEDADGSLLVIDTGGWYKLCCPTSQLAKPDVLGGIYRVRRKGAPKMDDPRGLKLAWAAMKPVDLAKLLDDNRPAVRRRAIHQLAKQGSAAVPALEETLAQSGSVEARRNAVWALTRIEGEAARAAVRRALTDADASIRQAAVHSTSVWRDPDALSQLLDLLASPLPHLARAVAEALGRIGDQNAVPHLLAAAGVHPDRILEHSLIFAMIEIADPIATAYGLTAASPQAKRAALIALDQMEGGGLRPETVTSLLVSSDPLIKETAWWIAGHHPEWGRELAGFFRQRLAGGSLRPVERDPLEEQLAQFSRNGAIQQLLADTAGQAASREARVTALGAMARTHLKQMPPDWTATLVRILAERDAELLRSAVAVARVLPASKEDTAVLSAALLNLGRSGAVPPEIRLEALAAMPVGLAGVEPALFDFLRASIDPAQPLAVRTTAASVLGRAKLSREQLVVLTDPLRNAGPMELLQLLPAFDNGRDEALGLKLIEALDQSSGRSNLRADVLKARLVKYPEPVQKKGEQLLAALDMDSAKQKTYLEQLLASLKGGDIRRGQAVFNSQKSGCRACHAIGYLGGKVGPDLTRIGRIRTERDLLEAIVYPSASFVRSYEPVVVVTKSGDMHNGVLRQDAPDQVVLATGPTDEVRIARSEIAEMRPGTVSVMPSGLDKQLTRRELADLLAFLKAAR
jgi:putative membrane-bound dehydrogenase-like protein